MAQLYTSKPSNSNQLIPSQETIRFLLDYSKAVHVISKEDINFECILN